MDVEDDDAFLYGDQSPPPEPIEEAVVPPVQAQSSESAQAVKANVSAAMAASLAAYGIDPSTAVAAPVENNEDGGVEEEDLAEDSDSDEDDIKLDFTGQASRLNLRQPQTQTANVVGIGKWAHTSTGQQSTQLNQNKPKPVAILPNQITEYTPSARPGTTPTPSSNNLNPPIPSSGDIGTALTLQPSATNGALVSTGTLPPSGLPPVTAPPSHPKIDPTNPSGVIPSTGQSVYDIDLAQFEGSGQPWRQPGSDVSAWFNYGFDEVTFPKFLRYRAEMEAGRQALSGLNPMNGIPSEMAQLLHIGMGRPDNSNLMGMLPNGMGHMNGMNMGLPGMNMGVNPQQLQMMQQMMAVQGGMGMEGMMGQQALQQPGQQGVGMVPTPNPGNRPRPSITPAVQPESSEDVQVKQEEGEASDNGQDGGSTQGGPTGQRGRGLPRGAAPTRGLRGRGAIPVGPRSGMPVPTGPKAGRFKDKDRATTETNPLDYGDSVSASVRSPSPGKSRSPSPKRKRAREYDSYSEDSRDRSEDERYYERERERSKSKDRRRTRGKENERDRGKDVERDRRDGGRERDRGKDVERDRGKDAEKDRGKDRERDEPRRKERKRDDGTNSGGLGPGGWESGSEEERRLSRRRRSASEEDRHRTRTSKRR
ncbi:hypothetical protein M231_03824 [Tremella mesenterica]|uniref:Pre-mRNA polyadenylation factor Fip1 domain-containing protein n=1 Tax=Tremella mesenterica TaxID=5217 RepID=A0A4Q1BM39_TREME|nr:hypothetical protein M231_03824 [Tremella mesenterica]